MTRFSGQTAVITGAAGRLGSAVARRLVNEGASVMLADMNLSAVTALAQSLDNDRCRVGAFQVDIASAAEVAGLYARTFELFGRIDVVHNNAAMIGDGPDGSSNIGELPLDVWSRTLNVNVTGAMHVIKHALPYMIRQGSGAIVNTSSIASLLGEDVRSAYSASKAALNALTRHVATAYGRHGIRCNAVAPGLMRADASSPDAAPWRRHNAVPYVGTFDDVALVVAFLASSDARYVTGQVIVADGGFSAHFPNWADGGHRTGLGPAPTT